MVCKWRRRINGNQTDSDNGDSERLISLMILVAAHPDCPGINKSIDVIYQCDIYAMIGCNVFQ